MITLAGLSKMELEEIIVRHGMVAAAPECALEIFNRLAKTAQVVNGAKYIEAMRDKYEYDSDTIKKTILAGVEPYPMAQMLADLNRRGQAGWELVMISSAQIPPNHFLSQSIWKRKIVGPVQ